MLVICMWLFHKLHTKYVLYRKTLSLLCPLTSIVGPLIQNTTSTFMPLVLVHAVSAMLTNFKESNDLRDWNSYSRGWAWIEFTQSRVGPKFNKSHCRKIKDWLFVLLFYFWTWKGSSFPQPIISVTCMCTIEFKSSLVSMSWLFRGDH